MPAKKGYTDVHIAVEDTLLSSLSVLAAQPDFEGSKSKVVDAALRAFVESTANMQAVDNFHQHLSAVAANLTQVIHELTPHVTELTKTVQQLQGEVRALEQKVDGSTARMEHQYINVVRAYDALRAQVQAGQSSKSGFFSRS